MIVFPRNGEDFHAGKKLIVEKVTQCFIKIITQMLGLQTVTIR